MSAARALDMMLVRPGGLRRHLPPALSSRARRAARLDRALR